MHRQPSYGMSYVNTGKFPKKNIYVAIYTQDNIATRKEQ